MTWVKKRVMSRNKIKLIKFLYLYLTIAMAISIAFWLAYIVRGPNTPDSVVSMKGTTNYTNPPASSKPNAGPEKTDQVNGNTLMESTGGISLEDTAIAGALKDKYGAGIFNVRVQMYAMEKLMAYMKTRYPDKWQERVFSILRIAFPELAETMIDRFKMLLNYKNWLLDNQEYLRSLSLKERQDMLWEKRREIFGSDTDLIWAEELKAEKILGALDTVRRSQDTNLSEKLYIYKDAIDKAYGEEAKKFMQEHAQELVGAFLETDPVQEDLSSMTPEEREAKLQQIRKALGMDEPSIERWRSLDRLRDNIWHAGASYMRERESLVKSYKGDDLEKRLDELRKHYFGKEAETIKHEEASGFFRFKQRRLYGLN